MELPAAGNTGVLADESPSGMEFENLYIATRQKENRIYSDLQVAKLPFIELAHPHFNEWNLRGRSAARLIRYLGNKNRPLTMLEVGCGNGWLSARLSGLKNSIVTGMDINRSELNQAGRVFGSRANIHFVYGDLRSLVFNEKFDIIIFAASIQYFPDFNQIISKAITLLNGKGEIHMLDSYFYRMGEMEKAAGRSRSYYHSIGILEMATHYFHHTSDLLKEFNHEYLFKPSALKNMIFGNKDPFPWICITP